MSLAPDRRDPARPGATNRYYVLDDRSIEAAVAALAPRLRGQVLDLGAGTQPYAPLVRRFVTRYVTLDRMNCFPPPAVVGEGSALPFKAASFDGLLCTQVLEHVPDPAALLQEIARVLKPGADALLTVPLNAGVHLAPNDYFRFTEFGLRRLCKQAGLELVLLQERGGRVLAAAQAVMLVFEMDTLPRRSLPAALVRRGGRLLTSLLERIAPWIDRRWPVPGNPLGYAAVLRKP